jgi:hypothetical protein
VEEHLTHVRELERLVDEIPEPTASCVVPAEPGADPPVELTTYRTDTVTGYAEEDRRVRVMTSLLKAALACDLVRSASLMYTYAQSFMNVAPVLGHEGDQHQQSHGNSTTRSERMADTMAWHVKHFARLVDQLRATPDGDGTLLDDTALVLLFEGGYGRDPETNSASSPHSSENMSAIVAGGAFGTAHGRHVAGARRHPASLTLAAMRAVGATGPLGEVTTPFPL